MNRCAWSDLPTTDCNHCHPLKVICDEDGGVFVTGTHDIVTARRLIVGDGYHDGTNLTDELAKVTWFKARPCPEGGGTWYGECVAGVRGSTPGVFWDWWAINRGTTFEQAQAARPPADTEGTD